MGVSYFEPPLHQATLRKAIVLRGVQRCHSPTGPPPRAVHICRGRASYMTPSLSWSSLARLDAPMLHAPMLDVRDQL